MDRFLSHSLYIKVSQSLLESERLCIDIEWLTSSQLRLLSKQTSKQIQEKLPICINTIE